MSKGASNKTLPSLRIGINKMQLVDNIMEHVKVGNLSVYYYMFWIPNDQFGTIGARFPLSFEDGSGRNKPVVLKTIAPRDPDDAPRDTFYFESEEEKIYAVAYKSIINEKNGGYLIDVAAFK